MPLEIPANYPVVGFGLGALFFFNLWQANRVIRARKEYGVALPNLYASAEEAKADPKKNKFNCVQRAHQNTIESVSYIIGMTLFTGLANPIVATALLFFYIAGRVGYTVGYSTGDPKARMSGLAPLQYVGILGLTGYTIYFAAATALGF